MNDEVEVLCHSSIRITGERTIYFDPFHITKEYHNADLIFVTHEHYDHYSPEDIEKVKNNSTMLICPRSMEAAVSNSGIDEKNIRFVTPNESLSEDEIQIEVIPAYNVGKQFHPKEMNWVGYVVTMNDTRYYVAGDTDDNEDVRKVKCDVALLPVGGKYTMNVEEAVHLAGILNPKKAIPTHFGSVAGEKTDGVRFLKLWTEL